MNITDQTALVTGANRGIGKQFVLELLDRGVGKVYAAARRPETIDIDDARVVRSTSTCSTGRRSPRPRRPRSTCRSS